MFTPTIYFYSQLPACDIESNGELHLTSDGSDNQMHIKSLNSTRKNLEYSSCREVTHVTRKLALTENRIEYAGSQCTFLYPALRHSLPYYRSWKNAEIEGR